MNYDIAYVYKAIDQFSGPLKKINEAMTNFEKQTKKTEQQLDKLTLKIQSAGRYISTRLVPAFAALLVYSAKNAEQFDRMRIKLEAVAGSSENAAKIMERVKQLALATGLSPESLTAAATGLSAAGYSLAEVNQKLQQMSMFAVVSGKNVDDISSKFIRMRSLGFTSSKLLGSMAQEGLPVISAFKEFYHLSDRAWTMLAKKRLSFKLLEPVIDNMTKKGSAFEKAYQRALLTSGTSMARLHNAIRIVSADFGEAFMKAFHIDDKLKELADHVGELEPKFERWLNKNEGLLKMSLSIMAIVTALSLVAGMLLRIKEVLILIGSNPQALALLTSVVAAAKAFMAVKEVMNINWSQMGTGLKNYVTASLKGGESFKQAQAAAAQGLSQGAGDVINKASTANIANQILGGQNAAQTQNINVNATGSVAVTQPGQATKTVPLTFDTGQNMGHAK